MNTFHVSKSIELWSPDRLIPYDRNARQHSREQITQIAAAIEEFGFTNPILVDSKAGIVAGHARSKPHAACPCLRCPSSCWITSAMFRSAPTFLPTTNSQKVQRGMT